MKLRQERQTKAGPVKPEALQRQREPFRKLWHQRFPHLTAPPVFPLSLPPPLKSIVQASSRQRPVLLDKVDWSRCNEEN